MALEESLRRSNARFMATINSILERVRAARAAVAVGWREPLAAAFCFRRRPEAGLAGTLCQRRDLQAAAVGPRPCLSEGRRALLRSLLPKWCAARPGRPCASLSASGRLPGSVALSARLTWRGGRALHSGSPWPPLKSCSVSADTFIFLTVC